MVRRERTGSAPSVDTRGGQGVADASYEPAEMFSCEGVGVGEEAEVAEGWEGMGCGMGG